MTEKTITSPCSPGDTLWAIVGDQVRLCKVEKLAIYVREAACSISLDIVFVAPNPFVRGQEKTYNQFAILGHREPGYRAVYPTKEEAEQALAKEGPDFR